MAGRSKSAKAKQQQQQDARAANEMAENLAAFTLPESLPCSEVSFPVLIQRKAKANWKAIVIESELRNQEIQEFVESKRDPVPKSPFLKTECDYVKEEIFQYLIPALEETLNKAKIWNAFANQRCFFNGVDWICQLLWNNNPKHPERQEKNLHLFNMPWVRAWLRDHPRPIYPKSWIWPEEYAATLIQKTIRQYFVQREEEVQELREFWKKLEVEKENPELDTNPLLLKKFASVRNVR